MTTRDNILTQSFKLFLNEGYKEVSINKIIGNCNISKGAFYHYFTSKEDLYSQVLERFFFNYFDNSDFTYDENLSLAEKLQYFIISFASPYEELLELTSRSDLIHYFRFLFHAAGHDDLTKYRINKHFYKKGYYLSILIKEEQKKNGFEIDASPKAIARQFLSMVLGIILLDGINDASTIKAQLIASTELFLSQILISNKALA